MHPQQRIGFLLIALACTQPAHAGLIAAGETAGASKDYAAHPKPQPDPQPGRSLADTLRKLALVAENDPGKADPGLDALLEDPGFDAMPEQFQHDAFALSAWTAWGAGDEQKALSRYRRAAEIDPNVFDDWHPLAILEFTAGNHVSSAKAIVRLAQQWPDRIEAVEFNLIAQLISQSRLAAPVRKDLLQALTQADWRRGRTQNSELWYELTLAHLIEGQLEPARKAAHRVFTPMEIIKLRSDKRFDSLIDRNTPSFDAGLAARTHVQTLQKVAGDAPDSLELRNELTDAMLTSGMTEAALAHADLILAKLEQMDADDPAFSDAEDRIWTMNNRAVALRRLGRLDEAAGQLAAAAELDEEGSPNVSQLLNLGQFYSSLRRPEEAQAAIARAGDDLSRYGKMVQASIAHRVALQTGNAADAKKAEAYMRRHRQDSQIIYFWSLLERQQLDQAADMLKELLANPEERSTVLGWFQQTLEAPPLPGDILITANKKAVLERADVQAAVARVGHVDQYPVFTGYMRD